MSLWIEISFDETGQAQYLVFTGPENPDWMDDMSMQGIYTGADGYIEGTWTQMWYYGSWNDLCPGYSWSSDYFGLSGTEWTFGVDFDGDGFVDVSWQLTRIL
jgi:hypothetical protein